MCILHTCKTFSKPRDLISNSQRLQMSTVQIRRFVSIKLIAYITLGRTQGAKASQYQSYVSILSTVIGGYVPVVHSGQCRSKHRGSIMTAIVNELGDLLQGHANRDKVMNLASYALKFCGSTTKRQDLMNASARLAAARASLRLLDDALAIKTALAYGLGKPDGPFWGALGVAGSAFTLGYLQAEKLSWLIDTGMLQVSKDTEFKIRTAHKLFWSLSAFVGFIRSIRALNATSEALKSPDRTKCAPARFTQASLTTTKFLLDTVHAVSWLPPGWLWGSKLSVQQASGVATAAAVLGLVIHYHGKRF